MRALSAMIAALGVAAAQDCPAHSAVADVFLGSAASPAAPLHAADGTAWSWIPQDGVVLKSFTNEPHTLTCGNYYGYQCRRTENNTQLRVACHSDVCDVYAFIYHEPPRSSQTNGRLPLSLPAASWQTGSCAPEFCLAVSTDAPTGSTDAPTGSTDAPTGSTDAPTGSTDSPTRSTFAPLPTFTAAPMKTVISHLPGHPDAELPDARKGRALDVSAATECCRMTAFRKQANGGSEVQFTIDEVFGTMDAYYLVLAVAPGVDCGSNSRQTQEECEDREGNAQCKWVEGEAEPVVGSRAAEVLSGIPTSSPTASPVGGRCVDNWCPRRGPPVQVPRPVCSAPLTEPQCQGS